VIEPEYASGSTSDSAVTVACEVTDAVPRQARQHLHPDLRFILAVMQ
jgi:hypothetical protein